MNLPDIATLAAAFLNAMLGLFVLFRAPAGRASQAFAAFALSLSLWISGMVCVSLSSNWEALNRASTLVFIGGCLIGSSLAWLAGVFPRRGQPLSSRLRVFIVLGLPLAAFAPTGCYVKAATGGPGHWTPVNGPLFPVFALYLGGSAVFFLATMAVRWRRERGLMRLQAQYLLMGLAMTLVVGMFADVLAPNAQYRDAGPIASLCFVGCSAYAIARYRLLDISWVIRQGVAYGLTLVALAMGFMGTVAAIDRSATSWLGADTVGAQAALAMLLAMLFQPVHRLFLRLVNAVFSRREYDYPMTLRAVSRAMTSMLDLDQLRSHLSGTIVRFMQVDRASLSLRGPQGWEVGGTGSDEPGLNSPLLRAMQSGQILIREELSQHEFNSESQAISRCMKRLNADVAVPLIFKEELVGILFVGAKRSGSVFSEEDIALLSTLANQGAIAVRNAQLYRELHVSHQYTQAILERLDSAVLTVNSIGAPIVVNEAAREILPRQDGQPILPDALLPAVERVFRTGREETDLEFDIVLPSGISTPVVATVCPFMAEQGQVESALVVMRDISVLRRLEDERVRTAKLSSMSRLAATLAHEIRNPLASIKTFCQLLPEMYMDAEFRDGFSRIAFHEVERIDALVGNLLAVDKPIRGAWEPVHLVEVLESTLQFMQPMLLDRGLTMDYYHVEGPVVVMGDSAQMRQLFLNLLLNAHSAAPHDSVIEVRVFRTGDAHVITEISNGGDPIPPDLILNLFEPFVSAREGGTGLGLAVCKQIADYHGGTMSVDSNGDEGARFRFSAPLAGALSGQTILEAGAFS